MGKDDIEMVVLFAKRIKIRIDRIQSKFGYYSILDFIDHDATRILELTKGEFDATINSNTTITEVMPTYSTEDVNQIMLDCINASLTHMYNKQDPRHLDIRFNNISKKWRLK